MMFIFKRAKNTIKLAKSNPVHSLSRGACDEGFPVSNF